jgi:hypothetical protein
MAPTSLRHVRPPPNPIVHPIAYISTFKDMNLPIFALLYVGWKIFKKTKIVRFCLNAVPTIQKTHAVFQIPLSQLDFVTVGHSWFYALLCVSKQRKCSFQGIPSLVETEETVYLEKPTGMQKIRQFL